MKVINLYGGPGTGKSTGAAYIFAQLKLLGRNVELVTEYAKQKVYEQSEHLLSNQMYITAKQHKKLKDLENYGVEIAVSDSPLLLGTYYGRDLPYYSLYNALVVRLNQEFENIDVFLNRVKPYNPAGRLQTESESDAISLYMKEAFGFSLKVDGNPKGYDEIIRYFQNVHP
jgi:hypothetical protein